MNQMVIMIIEEMMMIMKIRKNKSAQIIDGS
jgi:hypothetical protein